MNTRIEIETDQPILEAELMDNTSLQVGQSHTIPGNALLILQASRGQKTFGFNEILMFVLQDIGLPVATGIVANHLYAKLKGGRAKKLRVQNRDVKIDVVEIKRALDESVRIEGLQIREQTIEREE